MRFLKGIGLAVVAVVVMAVMAVAASAAKESQNSVTGALNQKWLTSLKRFIKGRGL